MGKLHLALLAVVLSLGWSPPAGAQEVLDRAVVRNRLYTVSHRLELSLDASLALLPTLVNHGNFTASFAFNLTEEWGIELRAGYAASGHTGLANNLGRDLLKRDPNGPTGQVVTVNDLAGLWEMKGNALLGARWAPLYGKLNLVADVPVHFQIYLWGGAGVGSLHRQSVVTCTSVASRTDGTCNSWHMEDRPAVLGSAALGMRFFIGGGALRAEVRTYIFGDGYSQGINRAVAESGGTTGTPAASPGVETVTLFDLGYTFFFL